MRVLCFVSIFFNINNLVLGLSIFVFHIDNLRARRGVVIYAFYPFFHQKITSVCEDHYSPVKIDRFSALIENIILLRSSEDRVIIYNEFYTR